MPKSARANQNFETVHDLERCVRALLPGKVADADEIHVKRWGSLDPDYSYSWFESLANALNADMVLGAGRARFSVVTNLLSQALHGSSPEVRDCIDVAFVENLFWQIGPDEAEAYWHQLPKPLQDLYVAFHGYTPLKV
jgi:hypothetical protein